MVLDSQGNPIVMGVTNSTNFPETADAFQARYAGAGAPPYDDYGDGFLMHINGSTGAVFTPHTSAAPIPTRWPASRKAPPDSPTWQATPFPRTFRSPAGVLQANLNTKVAGTPDAFIMRFTFGSTQVLPTIGGASNAASYSAASYAPGEIVTVFGQNMGPTAVATAQIDPATGRLATLLNGASVLFDGQAAPLVYVSAAQSAAVIPYEVAGKASTPDDRQLQRRGLRAHRTEDRSGIARPVRHQSARHRAGRE